MAFVRAEAVDAPPGRETREHGDIDVTVLHGDRWAIFEHLAGRQFGTLDPNGPGETDEPWGGRRLDLPARVDAGAEAAAVAARVGLHSSEGLRLELVRARGSTRRGPTGPARMVHVTLAIRGQLCNISLASYLDVEWG